jgi:hypothetical protein
MSNETMVIITRAAAWIAGITAGSAVLSCDVEPAETELVDREIDAYGCPIDSERLPPSECDKMARPSVHVYVAKRFEDYFAPVDVDAVWFEHEGHTFEARCLQGDDGCIAWIAGYELEGPITVSTEYCETVVGETVKVDRLPDGCHVQTQYMTLEVSTRGCLTSEDEAADPPPVPGGPWSLTTADTSQHPGHGPPGERPSDLTTPHHFPPPPPMPGALVSPG